MFWNCEKEKKRSEYWIYDTELRIRKFERRVSFKHFLI